MTTSCGHPTTPDRLATALDGSTKCAPCVLAEWRERFAAGGAR